MDSISRLINTVCSMVWGKPMIFLLFSAGIFLGFRTHFTVFTEFPHIIKSTVGGLFYGKRRISGGITPFQALSTALAGTMGTGNISGVAYAIIKGGPGAVFWMWISAFIGMCLKYCEVVLAVRYRCKNSRGEYIGGPMYYIVQGMGRRFRPLAVFFSFSALAASLGMGNAVQMNTISSSVISFAALLGKVSFSERQIAFFVGITVAIAAGTVLLGGISRLGSAAEKLVPFMSLLYIFACLSVIFSNSDAIGSALSQIFICAFRPGAAIGAIGGLSLKQVISCGFSRGIFSSEAGLGSAPIAHAASQEKDSVKQGFFGVFEVFADTLVCCTLTALALLTCKIPLSPSDNASAVIIQVFSGTFGANAAAIMVCCFLILFAFSTLLTWSLYGERCAACLFGEKGEKIYLFIYLLTAAVSPLVKADTLWQLSDIFNGLMAFPNLIALLFLSPVCKNLTEEYFGKLRSRRKLFSVR